MTAERVENLQVAQYKFTGAWLPDLDPAQIGPENFRTLENIRYVDGGIEGTAGDTLINTSAISTYTKIRDIIQLRTDRDVQSYVLVHAVDASGNGRIYQNQTAIPSQGDFEATQLHSDASANLTGRLSKAPQGHVAYCNGEESMIWAGEQMRCAAFITTDDANWAHPIDHTDKVNNTLTTAGNYVSIGSQKHWLVFSTRPLDTVRIVIKTANDTASSLTVKTFNGSSWAAVSSLSDGTDSGSISMAQTGNVTFTSTVGTSKPFHLEGLYLYAYHFELSAGTCEISHVNVHAPFQNMVDIWDGVYRQPIQAQNYNATKYDDYTLHVNESSTVDTPIGMLLDGLLSTDHVIFGFEERMAGIRFQMLAGLVNTNAAVTTMKYWNGSAFAAVSGQVDGTDNSGDTLGQSGTITWAPPDESSEVKHTRFGTTGYFYELTVSATLSGTKGSDAEIVVDIITGIPAQLSVKPFKFAGRYKNRLTLLNFEAGKEGNRMDFGLTDAPDVLNGEESSMGGVQSLYFGGSEGLTAATEIYNRFGSNIFDLYLVLKQNETFILDGNGPEDYRIYPVSLNIGCPAPGTLVNAEVGFEMGENLTRNVAVWLSYAGPVMFDGAVIKPLRGIQKYFDPNDSEFINRTYISGSKAWFDATYQEYNLTFPNGTSTTNNIWVAYSFIHQKWFKRNVGLADKPQVAAPVYDTNGIQYIYAGIDTGQLVRLENGSSWNGTGITYKVGVGDWWPTNNIWRQTLVRHLKLIAKAISEEHQLNVNYFKDADNEAGEGFGFLDTSPGFSFLNTVDDYAYGFQFLTVSTTTTDLSSLSTDKRLVGATINMNKLAWCHGFEFEVTTTTLVKAFVPIAWGILFEEHRLDGIK